jgi:hypothetical protein
MLKLAFAACLILAHQRFIQNKGLVLIILTSLAANIIVSFLNGLAPAPLVSITDGIAAIVVFVLVVLWAAFFLSDRSLPLLRRSSDFFYGAALYVTVVPGATRTPASGDCQRT